MSLLHPTHNPAITWPFDTSKPVKVKSIKDRVAASINESLSAESEAFSNYLATKLMREFNITLKD